MKNIRLKGAKNVRDFGGIKNKNGERIKEHLFIRGCALHALTEKDIRILKDQYQLSEIIDLRTSQEVKEKPDVQIEGVKSYHFSIIDEKMAGISHEEETDRMNMPIPEMTELYRKLVTEEYSLGKFRELFQRICDSSREGALLWHCTEGKDRCGLTSAFFLFLLDVEEKVILEDYLFTNKSSKKKARKYYWLIRLFLRDKEKARKVRNAFLADTSYLLAAIEAIQEKYGDMESFLREGLGITDEQRALLKSHCLEKE